MSQAPRIWAVVPAAGRGARMGSDIPKQYLELGGQTILQHTLARLLQEPRITAIVVALAADDAQGLAITKACGPRVRTTQGGAERCHSVLNGITALGALDDDWVLVHDAARPCLRVGDLARLIDDLVGGTACGGILGVPVKDTLKRCAEGSIEATVDRSNLWHALTPQMFRVGVLRTALEAALAAGRIVTDEAQAIELQGLIPRMIEGHADNLKITRPEDLPLAEHYLRALTGAAGD